MHLSLIQEGEELEKRATLGEWSIPDKAHCDEWYGMVKQITGSISVWGDKNNWTDEAEADAKFLTWMRTHAKELLEAARWAVENGYKPE